MLHWLGFSTYEPDEVLLHVSALPNRHELWSTMLYTSQSLFLQVLRQGDEIRLRPDTTSFLALEGFQALPWLKKQSTLLHAVLAKALHRLIRTSAGPLAGTAPRVAKREMSEAARDTSFVLERREGVGALRFGDQVRMLCKVSCSVT